VPKEGVLHKRTFFFRAKFLIRRDVVAPPSPTPIQAPGEPLYLDVASALHQGKKEIVCIGGRSVSLCRARREGEGSEEE